jgi:hypothetical protein
MLALELVSPPERNPAVPTTTTPKSTTPEPTTFANLVAALAAFQADLPSVRKNQTADVRGREGKASYSYDYADLTDVSEAVLPALAAVGLAWHTGLDTVDGNVVIRWELSHAASGEARIGTLPVGRAGNDWQSMGSSITYARRYALLAATGVAPGGDDDDAKSASTAGNRPAPVQKPVERPAAVQYLPEGLYDLSGINSKADAEALFYRARGAGHLNLAIQIDGQPRPFGAWLQETGRAFADAEAADPDAAAVAEHEATLTGAGTPLALQGDDTPF